MAISEEFEKVRKGFHRTFWVANTMELFERLAYYGQAVVLSIFLRNSLHFTEIETGTLSAIFGGLIYLFPIFAGTIVDKFGFKKAFTFAFFVLAIGYFLIGSTGMAAFQSFYSGMPLYSVLVVILIFTAFGGSFIKPSVLGTVALTSTPETKSLGYAIYYWLVNIGGAIGPVIAYFVRDKFGIEFVYVVSAISCAAMLFVNFFFYKEVKDAAGEVVESIGTKLYNLFAVLANFKFMIFLLIFSLYWIMFWVGVFIIVPFYVTDFISKTAPFEIIESADAWTIIALQLIVNRLTKRLPPRTAIIVGFGMASLAWLVIGLHPTIWTIFAGLAVFSIGEMTQAPRYYEYISDLAPKGQQGLFQGYAFLPVAIAWIIGGPFGGWLYTNYAKQSSTPETVWFVLFGVGVIATILMAVYNNVVGKREAKAA